MKKGTKLKAVIFDFDGVIIDSEYCHTKALQTILSKFFNLKLSAAEINKYIGTTHANRAKMLLKQHKIKKKFPKKYSKEYMKLATRNLLSEIKSRRLGYNPGLTKLVKDLRKDGYNIALGTMSPTKIAMKSMNALKIRKCFDKIATFDDVTKVKPDPQIYLLLAKKLKVRPKNCVVIEDAAVGVAAAKRAKMKCIGFLHKYNSPRKLARADLLVHSLNELSSKRINSMLK